MATGLPPKGGVPAIYDLSSFPPLSNNKTNAIQPETMNSGNKSMQNNSAQETTQIRLTYAESTRSKPFIPITSLPHLPNVPIKPPIISEKDGVKAVIFRQEEIEASTLAFKHALVARFYGERPPVDSFEHFINSSWGLLKPAVVGLLDPRHIMVRLSTEEDFIHAWTKEGCFFNNVRFVLSKWTDGLTGNKEIKRPVWIELHQLPVIYHSPSMLSHIGNNIGHFLKLDERTKAGKHPIAPRMCIELDFTKPLPNSVWVGHTTTEGNQVGQNQVITYDFRFSKCLYCKLNGHETIHCPKRDSSNSIAVKLRPVQRANPPRPIQPSKQTWVRKDNISAQRIEQSVGHLDQQSQPTCNILGKSSTSQLFFSQPTPTPPLFNPITFEVENIVVSKAPDLENSTQPLDPPIPQLDKPLVPTGLHIVTLETTKPGFEGKDSRPFFSGNFLHKETLIGDPATCQLGQHFATSAPNSIDPPNENLPSLCSHNSQKGDITPHSLNNPHGQQNKGDNMANFQESYKVILSPIPASSTFDDPIKNEEPFNLAPKQLETGPIVPCNPSCPNSSLSFLEGPPRKHDASIHRHIEGPVLLQSNRYEALSNSVEQAIVAFNEPEIVEPLQVITSGLKSESCHIPLVFAQVENKRFEAPLPSTTLDGLLTNLAPSPPKIPASSAEQMQAPLEDTSKCNTQVANKQIELSPTSIPSPIKKKKSVSWSETASVHFFEHDYEDGTEDVTQAEVKDTLTCEPTKSTEQETKMQPSTLVYIRKAAQRHIKIPSKAIRVESVGRIDPGVKWADVLDSEDEN